MAAPIASYAIYIPLRVDIASDARTRSRGARKKTDLIGRFLEGSLLDKGTWYRQHFYISGWLVGGSNQVLIEMIMDVDSYLKHFFIKLGNSILLYLRFIGSVVAKTRQ